MSARQTSKGDDPLEPPRARTRTEGSAPMEPDQDREKPEQDQAAEQDQTAEDETKRKFREALAAKQGRKGEDHIDNAQQPVQRHGPAETKRTFIRRKTG
jgi:Skp family chaperone for outer membrane proteins